MSARNRDFEDLVREHARLMAAAIRKVCGRRHRALVEDAEQEVYLALWKRLEGGKPIAHPVSYLYKMALTTALKVVRRQRETVPLDSAPEPTDEAGSRHESQDLMPAERARLAEELLTRLDVDEARALRAWLAGFGHVEIADLFGWSESVARHRVYRSLERLRREERERAREPHAGAAPLGPESEEPS